MNDPKPRREPTHRLEDAELDAVSGGPTEELYGNYHFVVAGPDPRPNGLTPPIGSGKGS